MSTGVGGGTGVKGIHEILRLVSSIHECFFESPFTEKRWGNNI